jgi:hypothetical protein
MDVTVYPRAFNVAPGRVPTPTGDMDVMHVTILDAGGTTVRITFGADDWKGFQAFVADHEGETKKAAARARLLGADGRPVI